MRNRWIIFIIVAIIFAVSIVSFLMFRANPYTEYSNAFSKTLKSGAMEFNTNVKVSIDGKEANYTGNFKIKNIDSDVNFINVMNLEGETITQFTDGEYIYQDDGVSQTKFKIDDKPQMKEKGEFNMDSFEKEFAGLIDMSKIKELKIVDILDKNIIESIDKSGNAYNITLAEDLVQDLVKSMINEESQSKASPEFTLNKFSYKATENSSKAIDNITYYADFKVVFPSELTKSDAVTKNVILEIALTALNPGSNVEFTIPSTEGYMQ